MTVRRPTAAGSGRSLLLGLVLAGLCALLGTALGAAPASAHASLVSTDPSEGDVLARAPQRITLTFDENVALTSDGARLYNALGDEVSADARSVDRVVAIRPRGDMPEGTYVVVYRVVSADSHPVAGSLSFSVGAPSDNVVRPAVTGDASDELVRLVHGAVQGGSYVALLLAAGLVVYVVGVLPPAAGIERLRARLGRVLRWSAVAAVVGFLALVPLGVLYRQGLTLGDLSTAQPWTHWLAADGVSLALVALGLSPGLGAGGSRPDERSGRVLVLAGAALAVAALALVGHPRAYGPPVVVPLVDVAHVSAAATWFGGLVGLAISVPALARRERIAATALARFSLLAGGLLVIVAAAGTVLGWRILGSWGALFGTTYGWVLIGKVAIVAVVAGLAGWNRYRLLPGVLAAHGDRAREEAAERLRVAVRTEAGLLVVVLLLTGFLVNLVPRAEDPFQAAPRTTETTVSNGVKLVARIDPARVGQNTVLVQVQDLAGNPVEPLANPRVSLRAGDADLGSRPVRNLASGTYEADVVIPSPGSWTLVVSVRTSELDNPVLTLDTTIG